MVCLTLFYDQWWWFAITGSCCCSLVLEVLCHPNFTKLKHYIYMYVYERIVYRSQREKEM
jgi:hypothetical protein